MLSQNFRNWDVNDKEVSQISHLKFIPGHMLHGEIYKQVYQGRAGDELVDLINPNWVRWVFDQQFCYYVMRLGVQQWNKYGERRKMTWVPVPLGAARDGNHHQGMLVDTVPIKYPQYDLETCTFMSMASALHYCSSVLKMGDKLVGNTLAQGAVGYIKGMSARAQLDTLIQLVISKSTYFKKYELRAKQSKIEEWDILNRKTSLPTVVVLLGSDGGMNHTVTVVDGLVFDSNCSYAMRLSKKTFDWCCNCKDGYNRATYAVRFWN